MHVELAEVRQLLLDTGISHIGLRLQTCDRGEHFTEAPIRKLLVSIEELVFFSDLIPCIRIGSVDRGLLGLLGVAGSPLVGGVGADGAEDDDQDHPDGRAELARYRRKCERHGGTPAERRAECAPLCMK